MGRGIGAWIESGQDHVQIRAGKEMRKGKKCYFQGFSGDQSQELRLGHRGITHSALCLSQ